MDIFSDQIADMTRLVTGGGLHHRNVLGLKCIAHVAAHRSSYAADLAKELMYDDELRFDEGCKELRRMHS